MAEKIFSNVRLGLKVDTLENWGSSSLVLKRGELAFATVAASAGTGLTEPVVMVKIGDGEHTFKDLQWNFYAKASDVLAACKSEDALKAFVNSVIADAGIASDEAMEELAGRVTTAEGEIDTLQSEMDAVEAKAAANETAIGTLNGLVGDTKVADQITAAINGLNLATTYEAKGEAAKVQTALDTYKTSNDAAVQKNTTDIAGEITRAKAAEEANASAIATIKDGTTIDSFADVEAALAGKQATGDYATKAEAQAMADGKDAAIAEAKKAGTDAAAAASAAQADVDALETLVGETKVSEQISTAITGLDLPNTYAAKAHTHVKADITDFAHTHEIADVNGLQTALDGKQAAGDYATKADAKGYADAKDGDIAAAKAAADKAQEEVDALETYVGTIPDGYTETNVVAYINKKAEETLNAASGGSSESAASVLAALNTYKTENDPKVQANTEAIAELEELVGETSVAEQISGAIENALKVEVEGAKVEKYALAADLDAEVETARAAEKANADAIKVLNGDAETEGSVNYKVAQAVAAIMENPDETMNSINELVTWVNDHAEDALEMSNQVAANKTALETLNGDATKEGSVAKQISDAIDAENLDQYATAENLGKLDERVAAVEGDLNTETTGLKARMTAAEADIDALELKVGDKSVSDQITAVTNPLTERVVALEAVDHEHANKTVLDGITAGQVTAWDAAVQTVTAGTGLKATKTGTDVAIDLDETCVFIFDCGTSAE